MIKGKKIEWRSLRDGSDGILGCVDKYSFYEIHEQVLGNWSISFVREPNRPTIYDIVSLAEAKKQCDVLLEAFINDIVAENQESVTRMLFEGERIPEKNTVTYILEIPKEHASIISEIKDVRTMVTFPISWFYKAQLPGIWKFENVIRGDGPNLIF